MPEAPHRLRDPILDSQLLVEAGDGANTRRGRRRPVQPRGHGVVRELRAVEHDGAVDLGVLHLAAGTDDHLGDDRQTLLPFAQRREDRRQLLRQHREDPAAVYTEVVFVCACSSIELRRLTVASTSATAT